MRTVDLSRAKQLTPDWGKAAARGGVRGFGQVTSRQRRPPDYLIIGAKRGGTTSLWWNLQRHPLVMPLFPSTQSTKSPHYFDINYAKGRAWYLSHFPSDRARRRVQGDSPDAAIVGDASPYYMFHPLAADRVLADLPDVRVIVALRNPVDRAYSHYKERVKEGTEGLSFEDALAAEDDRTAGEAARIMAEPGYYSHHHEHSTYLARGRYLEQLTPWLPLEGEGRLLVLRSEDFYDDPQAWLERAYSFLGLPSFAVPATKHYNKLGDGGLSDDTRKRLEDYFRPSVDDLQGALGRDFDWF